MTEHPDIPNLDELAPREIDEAAPAMQLRCSGKKKGKRITVIAQDDATGVKVKLTLPNMSEENCDMADTILAAMPMVTVQVVERMVEEADRG